MITAVVDTNVFVSGLLNPLGAPGKIVDALGDFTLIVSPELLAEFEDVLTRPHILRAAGRSREQAMAFVSDLRAAASVVEPARQFSAVARDPSDNRVLEAALAGGADYIVSGDRDLTDLIEFEGIPILPPAAFLVILEQDRSRDPES